MVRLVSSRLHRCYSASVVRSSTIEKLTCILHIISCAGFVMTGDWASHLVVSPSASPIPSPVRTFSILLLITVHCLDFGAVCTSHMKFHKPSSSPVIPRSTPEKSTSKTLRKSPSIFNIFLASPDFVVTFIYMFSTLVLLFSTIHYHHYYIVHAASAFSLLPPSDEQHIEQQLQVRTSLFFVAFTTLAAIINVIVPVCNPRILFANHNSPHSTRDSNPVFLSLVRLHNFVSALFQVACSTKLISLVVLIFAGPDPVRQVVRLTADMIFASNIVILIASVANLYRVIRFASATHFWALHDAKRLGNKSSVPPSNKKKSLLSWFRSPSKTGDDSEDADSDNYDDFNYSLDDANDGYKPNSKRLVLPDRKSVV